MRSSSPGCGQVTRTRSGSLSSRRYHPSLLRLAQTMVPSRAVAEEVVQDTWLGLVRGIQGFEGRSSLRTGAVPRAGQCSRQVVTRRDSAYLAQMRRTLDALERIDCGALEPEVADELISRYRRLAGRVGM